MSTIITCSYCNFINPPEWHDCKMRKCRMLGGPANGKIVLMKTSAYEICCLSTGRHRYETTGNNDGEYELFKYIVKEDGE